MTELYGLDPDQFITRRKALAAELRGAGDREGARRLLELRKPAIHVWAVNQLARRQEIAVSRLLGTAADVAEAQQRALSGGREGGERLRRDAVEYQRALDLATREALAVLRRAGRGATEETARRVRDVLAGAAVGDDAVRDALRSGTLRQEPPPPGLSGFSLGALPGSVVPGPAGHEQPKSSPTRSAAPASKAGPRPEPPAALAEARRDADAAAAAANRAEQTARRLRRRADALAVEAESADREAREAEQVAEANRAEASTAARRLKALQDRG